MVRFMIWLAAACGVFFAALHLVACGRRIRDDHREDRAHGSGRATLLDDLVGTGKQ